MYFPLFRGKQFELVALKEFAEEHPANPWLCPIIEPVRVLPDALLRAADMLSKKRIRYCVVLNPEQGDFAITTNRFDASSYLQRFSGFAIQPIPAFIADGKSELVRQQVDELGLQDVMVIFEEALDFENSATQALCNHPNVSYILCGDADSRGTKRFLLRTEKYIVRLDNNFEVHKPNTAYRSNVDEPYTEEPFYYRDDGFYGFSDYCVLPKEFAEGGMTPTAVAIHMTYRKREDSIWVQHFVSGEDFDSQNIRLKYGDAIDRMRVFYQAQVPTSAAAWLIQHHEYPGLGVLKKITMKNHMELVTDILPALVK